MARKDRFIWKDGDIEMLHVTVRAITYDAARNRLREVEVIDRSGLDQLSTQSKSA